MIWHSSYHSRIAQIIDCCTAVLSFIASYFISKLLFHFYPNFFRQIASLHFEYLYSVLALSIVYVFLFSYLNAYSYQRFTSKIKEYSIVLKVNFTAFLIIMAYIFFVGLKEIPRTYLFVFSIVSITFFIIQKTLLFHFANRIRLKGKNRKRVLLIGTGPRAINFIKTVEKNFSWGLDIIGILTADESKISSIIMNIKVIDTIRNLNHVLKEINPEEIIISISTRNFDKIRFILETCETEGVRVRLNSDFLGHVTKNITIDNVFGLNIVTFNMIQHTEIELFAKRLIDIIGSIGAILLYLPFMIIASIGIMISDGRPVLYKWNVIGKDKKPFKSWKFRTMVRDADKIKNDLIKQNEMDGPVFKIKEDPRIFPFGKFLRKWSIDETPQLFSVLKGDMSLVGPRPSFPYELEKFESWHRRKLSVKPGITCLWQINGRSNINKFDDWVKLDLEYIDSWSVLLDIKILLKTIPSVLLGKGAR